jgi:hydroxylamine reductase (hybrid-cluster protein)
MFLAIVNKYRCQNENTGIVTKDHRVRRRLSLLYQAAWAGGEGFSVLGCVAVGAKWSAHRRKEKRMPDRDKINVNRVIFFSAM